MKARTAYWLVGGAVAGTALVAIVATSSAPAGPRLVKNRFGYFVPVDPLNDAWTRVKGNPGAPFGPEAVARRKMLPPDAYPAQDKYSKEEHAFQEVGGFAPQLVRVDEYGRTAAGVSGNPLASLAGVASIVLPYIPGIGTAASAALGAAIALGQGKSLKDAALAAGYYATPAHLRFAYSAGVGVASGQSIDATALGALDAQYPGARAAFEIGKKKAS